MSKKHSFQYRLNKGIKLHFSKEITKLAQILYRKRYCLIEHI